MVDRNSLGVVDGGYHYRSEILKGSKQPVSTGVFMQDEYRALSGLLVSRVDCANHPIKLGVDFQLVPNPNALNPIPANFRLRGTYFRVEEIKPGEYDVHREELLE